MNAKVFVVIDTNVLVSALLSKSDFSNPVRILEAVISGIITPVYNEEIMKEYREVLSRKKFSFDQAPVDALLESIINVGLCSDRKHELEEYFPDEDDRVFYEVALNVDDSFLITGNLRHFPSKPFVVTPSEMIEILTDKGLL